MSSRPTAVEMVAALRREDLDTDELVMKKDAVVINSYNALTQKVRDQAVEIEALREQMATIMKYEVSVSKLSRYSQVRLANFHLVDNPEESQSPKFLRRGGLGGGEQRQ
jgi:hypothetical protein